MQFSRADGKPACTFGVKCYRKNSQHWLEYDHPQDHPFIINAAPRPAPQIVGGKRPADSDTEEDEPGAVPAPSPITAAPAVASTAAAAAAARAAAAAAFVAPAGYAPTTPAAPPAVSAPSAVAAPPSAGAPPSVDGSAASASGAAGSNSDGAGGADDPLGPLADGASTSVAGSGANMYTIKRTGDSYHCSCPAWKNQGGAAGSMRTCKHLKALRGADAELARLGGDSKTFFASGNRIAGADPPGGSSGADVNQQIVKQVTLASSWDGVAQLSGWALSEKLDGQRCVWDGVGQVCAMRAARASPTQG